MRLAAALATLVAAFALAACGGDDRSEPGTTQAAVPNAADFPAGDGQSLEELVGALPEGPIMAQTVSATHKGTNRVAFALFDIEKKQVKGAQVAVYVVDKRLQNATGPYVATPQSLDVEPQYRSRQTANDLSFNETIYSADVKLPESDDYVIAGIARLDGQTYRTSQFKLPKAKGPQPPHSGEKAPRIHTETAADVGGNLESIDTRQPPLPELHEVDAADVVGSKPTVLLFATPQLCQSRVCGPVDDVTFQIASDPRNKGVEFIHQEIYNGNEVNKGFRPQVRSFNLPTEPWVFVIDRNGVVRERIEGAFSARELQAAVDKVR